ncbi:ribonuclease [Allostella vacuolata]|nr:ribonuclease [Stella vacuolata]
MILVNTSVWVDHLRRGDLLLSQQLEASNVLVHHFVIGELACGNLRDRPMVLRLLRSLPHVADVNAEDALRFIDAHRLMGRGLGYVDVHLLATASSTPTVFLWTRDRRLAEAADTLGVGYAP